MQHKWLSHCWLVLTAILPVNSSLAANVADFGDFSLRDAGGNLLLPGRLYMPPEAATSLIAPRPFVVYLHGSGENGSDNVAQVNQIIDNLLAEAKRRGAFLYAPQTASNWNGRAITDRVLAMIDRALLEKNADARRVYVTGFSNGGGGTWNMLSRYDQRFAAAIPVSGVIPAPDFVPANLIGSPIWAFHARDDGVVPVTTSRNIISGILSAAEEPLPVYLPLGDPSNFPFSNPNLDLNYSELGVAGHNIWYGVSRIPKVYEWLFAHALTVPEPSTPIVLAPTILCLVALRFHRSAPTRDQPYSRRRLGGLVDGAEQLARVDILLSCSKNSQIRWRALGVRAERIAMKRASMIGLMAAAMLMAALGVPVGALGQGEIFDHETGIRGTRMWVPPTVPSIKGIVIFGNGAGGDFRSAVDALWLRQFAQLHDFALIATSMWGNLGGGEINIWDAHLQALAAASDHPELVHAPWAPLGFSNGGQMSYEFNALRPDKTIAFMTNKGCCYNNRTPPVASLKTPGILIAGELDTAVRKDSIRGLFETNRPRGALWSWVEQEGVGHTFDALTDSLILPFMAEAIRLRYPAGQVPTATSGVTLLPVNESDGWLADQTTWKSGLTQITAFGEYPGNQQTAGWLLNENVANLYRAFSSYNRDVSLEFDEPLQAPFELGVSVGFHTPSTVRLDLDLSAVPDWTKIELFNYAESVLTLIPTETLVSIVTLDAPIPHPGVYGFSALVTHAGGLTFSTTNALAYTAVPEPCAAVVAVTGIFVVLLLRLRPTKQSIGAGIEHASVS